jgi:hypothetical protein
MQKTEQGVYGNGDCFLLFSLICIFFTWKKKTTRRGRNIVFLFFFPIKIFLGFFFSFFFFLFKFCTKTFQLNGWGLVVVAADKQDTDAKNYSCPWIWTSWTSVFSVEELKSHRIFFLSYYNLFTSIELFSFSYSKIILIIIFKEIRNFDMLRKKEKEK